MDAERQPSGGGVAKDLCLGFPVCEGRWWYYYLGSILGRGRGRICKEREGLTAHLPLISCVN